MAIRPQQRFERGGNHQFDIPFCQDPIRILPVEDLALFRDFDLAGECARWLRNYGAMRWSSTASYRAATSMKQFEFDAAFTSAA